MSNFVLPDLQGRVALCVGQSPGLSNYVLGQASGYESASMLASQMPSHGHGGGSVTIQLIHHRSKYRTAQRQYFGFSNSGSVMRTLVPRLR